MMKDESSLRKIYERYIEKDLSAEQAKELLNLEREGWLEIERKSQYKFEVMTQNEAVINMETMEEKLAYKAKHQPDREKYYPENFHKTKTYLLACELNPNIKLIDNLLGKIKDIQRDKALCENQEGFDKESSEMKKDAIKTLGELRQLYYDSINPDKKITVDIITEILHQERKSQIEIRRKDYLRALEKSTLDAVESMENQEEIRKTYSKYIEAKNNGEGDFFFQSKAYESIIRNDDKIRFIDNLLGEIEAKVKEKAALNDQVSPFASEADKALSPYFDDWQALRDELISSEDFPIERRDESSYKLTKPRTMSNLIGYLYYHATADIRMGKSVEQKKDKETLHKILSQRIRQFEGDQYNNMSSYFCHSNSEKVMKTR